MTINDKNSMISMTVVLLVAVLRVEMSSMRKEIEKEAM